MHWIFKLNFAYELGGAQMMDYLPEDVDQEDAYGDLFRLRERPPGPGGPGVALLLVLVPLACLIADGGHG